MTNPDASTVAISFKVFLLKSSFTHSCWLGLFALLDQTSAMVANSEKIPKEYLSIVIRDHVDSGQGTTTERMHFDLGELSLCELEKLKKEAQRFGKGSYAFAFYMNRMQEEREIGVTIVETTKMSHTDKLHYSVSQQWKYADERKPTTAEL